MESTRSIEILLVEDNPGDIRLTQEALKESKFHNKLHIAHNGEEALAFLRHEIPFTHVPRPDLILLDLNMPRMSGLELLVHIKENPAIRSIPVVILTSSDAEKDIVAGYALHVNCYIVKPVDLDQFIAVVHAIEEFWIDIVRLPPRDS